MTYDENLVSLYFEVSSFFNVQNMTKIVLTVH